MIDRELLQKLPDSFEILKEKNGELLIGPSIMGKWKCWEDRWLRSLHISNDGSIISVGMPKFFNLNEGELGSNYNVNLQEIVKSGQVCYSEKLDGSLIIKYIHNEEVRFRTRGSLEIGLESWAKDVEIFKQKYPRLFDPICGSSSLCLLMEYVSPSNRIVIPYAEPDLYGLAVVQFPQDKCWWEGALSEIKLLPFSVSNAIFKNVHNIPVKPQTHLIATPENISHLIHKISKSNDIEGIVLRLDKETRLVKIKADPYLAKHALRSNLNTSTMIDLWLQTAGFDYQQFIEYFEKNYDYETMIYSIPIISAMFDGIREWFNQKDHLENFVWSNKELSRKDFAVLAQKRFVGYNLSICFLMLDNREIPQDLIKKMILQKTKWVDKSMFVKNEEN